MTDLCLANSDDEVTQLKQLVVLLRYWNCSCVILYLSDSTLRTSSFTQLPITSDCCKGYGPEETSLIFLLCGTGIVLALLYIYPMVPYAPAFLHSSRYVVLKLAKTSDSNYSLSLILTFLFSHPFSKSLYHLFITFLLFTHLPIDVLLLNKQALSLRNPCSYGCCKHQQLSKQVLLTSY